MTYLKSVNKRKESRQNLVFFHGFLCYSAVWNEFIKPFKLGYNIFLVTLPGHSGNEETITSVKELADNIAEEIKNKALQNINLIGHSLGGYIIGEIATHKNLKINSATLINSSLLADSFTKKENRDQAIRAVKIAPNYFQKDTIEQLFLAKHRKRLITEIEQLKNNALTISKKTIISYLKAMRNRDNTIENIKSIPHLFLASTKDTTIPIEQIEKQNIDNLIKLNNSNHMSFLEEREAVAKAIQAFFISLGHKCTTEKQSILL